MVAAINFSSSPLAHSECSILTPKLGVYHVLVSVQMSQFLGQLASESVGINIEVDGHHVRRVLRKCYKVDRLAHKMV